MNTVELIQASLNKAFEVLNQVTVDLTQEQADWTPPGIANPIGATYWHVISSTDGIVHQWIKGEPPLHLKDGWKEKIFTVSPPEPGQGGDQLAYERALRVDVPTLHAYSAAVASAVQQWLSALKPEDLEREVETPLGKLSVGKLLGTLVLWHLSAHCGEISALKGCQGARGYPF